ncbi:MULTISPECIES: hypothetical protein [unclassified Caballeronia]|uniref:hypothetical protein n=1 Tax=unclassified Caballeronia TaxID=2646786 RepID=UPI00285D9AB8|nr:MULTISPECIES: hypothetical protein [unclassified Caballeronia]MDR5737818.1 hypothetical protein [Caballeronia sp. LZ016]MDR5809646.1 hypothetical protein [Caballeronia sp. LZ019]
MTVYIGPKLIPNRAAFHAFLMPCYIGETFSSVETSTRLPSSLQCHAAQGVKANGTHLASTALSVAVAYTRVAAKKPESSSADVFHTGHSIPLFPAASPE